MAPVQEQLVVHRDFPDLGPQPLDLVVSLVGRPTLQRRLAGRQEWSCPGLVESELLSGWSLYHPGGG